MTYSGFPSEGIQFLRELAENNERQWFEAHKPWYVQSVQEPAVALVFALGERLQTQYPEIQVDPRTNGSGSLMRIHRDTRFSKDKSPYKTNVAMMFTPGGGKRMEMPGFGLQITPTHVDLIAGLFGFNEAHLSTYREAVLDNRTGAALLTAAEQLQAAGTYMIEGKGFKRVPRGFDASHPRAEWLMYKGLYVVITQPIPLEIAQTPELIDVVMTHFSHMAPIQQWLMKALRLTT